MTTDISLQLEVMANNKIIVPGCEPASELSSKTLASYMAKGHLCNNVLVNLQTALDGIPGSYVKYGANYNRGYRQKWFVFPPSTPTCPCQSNVDWYRILKSLAGEELPVEEKFDACDVIGMGYCPSPDFDLAIPPEASPYQPEGSNPVVGGVLPPTPPWVG